MNRTGVVMLALVMTAAAASAKPLPRGVKVTLKKGQAHVTMNGVTVQVTQSFTSYESLSAELSDDGRSLLLRGGSCGMDVDPEAEPQEVPLADVEALIENTKAMKLHLKKQYAESAKGFAAAVAKSPGTPLFATNLLSAQAMGNMLDDADKTLATIGTKHVAWFAWRLAVDPELVALKGRPSTAPFVAAKPGKVTVKHLLGDGVAVSPLGVVAARTYDRDTGSSFISFVELASGREEVRLPVTRKSSKELDRLLALLGMIDAGTLKDADGAKLPAKLDLYDVKQYLMVDKHVVFTTRSGGCDVSDFQINLEAEKL